MLLFFYAFMAGAVSWVALTDLYESRLVWAALSVLGAAINVFAFWGNYPKPASREMGETDEG